MDVHDCIATSPQHYAELAVRVATDRDFREHVRDKILAANQVLYENPAGVRDLEDFILRATAAT
jgi:predicted O-linked N-acetylglucosamine transferase (SPINDLY family)